MKKNGRVFSCTGCHSEKGKVIIEDDSKKVAEMIDVDERTIMKNEKGDSNPTLEVLFPLIQALKIDSWEIFNPKLPRESETQYQLCLLSENCTEEASVLVPVVESMKNALSK